MYPKISVLMRFAVKLAQANKVDTNQSLVKLVRALGGDVSAKSTAWKWLRTKWIEQYGDQKVDVLLTKAQKSKKVAILKSQRKFYGQPKPDFYQTDTWRTLRFEVLKASKGCCNLCGRSNREHGIVLHVDHIKPKSKWPELALAKDNLQVLCEDCNLGKSNRDDTDWRTATETDRQLDAVNWREI